MTERRNTNLAVAIGFIAGVLLTGGVDVAKTSYGEFRSKKNLMMAFSGEVGAIKFIENRRRNTWDQDLEGLTKPGDPAKTGARRWLVPEAVENTETLVFQKNAERIGILWEPLPRDIASFYMLLEQMKAEMQLLAGMNILQAGLNERQRLVGEHRETRDLVIQLAEKLLIEFEKADKFWWFY